MTLDKPPAKKYFDYSVNVHAFALRIDLSLHALLRNIPTWLIPRTAASILREKLINFTNSQVFYSDGSRIRNLTGFVIYHNQVGFAFRLSDPCSIFISELIAIYHCCQLIQQLPASNYAICSDSMSALCALSTNRIDGKTPHILLLLKQLVYQLYQLRYTIVFIWIPAHSSIYGNEEADSYAKEGALRGSLYQREIQACEYYPQIKEHVRSEWQKSWEADEFGRWCFSICPSVAGKPWFHDISASRNFIRNMSRIMSNHYNCKSHLFRINILQDNKCLCEKDYEDIDHIVWSCDRHNTERTKLICSLTKNKKPVGMPIRDVLGIHDIEYLRLVNTFLQAIEQKI